MSGEWRVKRMNWLSADRGTLGPPVWTAATSPAGRPRHDAPAKPVRRDLPSAMVDTALFAVIIECGDEYPQRRVGAWDGLPILLVDLALRYEI
jgi:hypothetical protein